MILAADVGTSSLKLVLFDRDGTPVDQAAVDYSTHEPHPGAREQEPGDWWARWWVRSATSRPAGASRRSC